MIKDIFIIVLLIVTVISIFYRAKQNNYIKEINSNLEKENKQLLVERKKLNTNIITLQKNKDEIDTHIKYMDKEVSKAEERLNFVNTTLEHQKSTSKQAFENYFSILEHSYQEAENEYTQDVDRLRESYKNLQLGYIAETSDIKSELEKLRSTRAAAMEAFRKEEELKKNSTDYCLQLSQTDLADMKRLESLKPSLSNQRVLSMLIWQSFVAKPIKTMWTKILGVTTVTGIYKITNQITGECYIGQASTLAHEKLFPIVVGGC